MQQECAAFVFGKITVIGDQQEIRLQIYDSFKRCKPAGFYPEIGSAALDEAGVGQQRTGQTVAAGNPAASGYREHAMRLARRDLAHMRNRGVKPVDFRGSAIWMLCDDHPSAGFAS